MAKFFYNRVYNSKRTIINIVIIAICVIGIALCFILTSNFQGEGQINKPKGELNIKSETTVEVNEKISKEVFFSKIENVNLDDVEVVYPDNYDISKIGQYPIKIIVDKEEYTSNLVVVDTTKPDLLLKEVRIEVNGSYSANDFVQSCTDNSNASCDIDFYNGIDEDGNEANYKDYKEAGSYPIKIVAKDSEGNQTVAETRLVIGKSESEEPPVETPVSCKYGNGEYDESAYTLTVGITTNNCAVSLDLYKDTNTTAELNKLMDAETIRIKRDVEDLNLTGTLSLSRRINVIVNKTGDGIVGYELRMIVNITNNNNTTTVVDYKLNSNNERIFLENPYNVASKSY